MERQGYLGIGGSLTNNRGDGKGVVEGKGYLGGELQNYLLRNSASEWPILCK